MGNLTRCTRVKDTRYVFALEGGLEESFYRSSPGNWEREAEEIAGPFPPSDEENRFMRVTGSIATRPESEGIVERIGWTDNETFEHINVWNEEEIQLGLENCRNGHGYELKSHKLSERDIEKSLSG